MKQSEANRAEFVTRDAIMKLLSDAEVALVSSREDGPKLRVDDEYLDLQHLDQGVRRMSGDSTITMGEVVPRSAVLPATWDELCARVENR